MQNWTVLGATLFVGICARIAGLATAAAVVLAIACCVALLVLPGRLASFSQLKAETREARRRYPIYDLGPGNGCRYLRSADGGYTFLACDQDDKPLRIMNANDAGEILDGLAPAKYRRRSLGEWLWSPLALQGETTWRIAYWEEAQLPREYCCAIQGSCHGRLVPWGTPKDAEVILEYSSHGTLVNVHPRDRVRHREYEWRRQRTCATCVHESQQGQPAAA